MAVRAEGFSVSKVATPVRKLRRPRIAAAIGNWFREGQMGFSSSSELGRHTGARI